MTESLLPLLDSTNDAFELELLGSMALDEPGAHLLPATAAALGVSALLTSTTNAAAHVSGVVATAANASGTVASTASGFSIWIGVLKSLAVGTVAGVALSGAATLALQNEPSVTESPVGSGPAPLSTSGPRVAVTAHSLAESAHAPHAPVDVLGKAEHATPPDTRRARKSSAVAASSAASEPSVLPAPQTAAPGSIAAEVAALDAARALLRQGQPRGAASVIERYRERWPDGALSREASMLMVEALASAGDRAAAEREAARAGFGDQADRYATRVRELLGKAPAQ